MKNFLLVGIGSFMGGVSRYYLSGFIMHIFPAQRLPLATMAVNFIGCAAIGILAGLAERHLDFFSPSIRLLLITGLLGGFTTFSAFGYETIYLFRTAAASLALLNIFLSIIICLLAVWIGERMAIFFLELAIRT